MDKPQKPSINIPTEFASNGVKTDFTAEKLLNGFPEVTPDVLAGDNLNKFIDFSKAFFHEVVIAFSKMKVTTALIF